VIKVLEKRGYHQARTKGSHVMMRGGGMGVTVPLHNPVAPGTLRAILRDADLTVEEFVARL